VNRVHLFKNLLPAAGPYQQLEDKLCPDQSIERAGLHCASVDITSIGSLNVLSICPRCST
jgi:hypothetical protein